MRQYKHRFTVQSSLAAVADFHSRSSSMGTITPPPIIVRVHQAPERLEEGDEMRFTLWLGPIPIHWNARIEQCSPNGFVDRQLRGPYKSWVHRHQYKQIDESKTEILDQIQVELKANWLWRLVGWGLWAGLPILFTFRAWKTRHILETTGKEKIRS